MKVAYVGEMNVTQVCVTCGWSEPVKSKTEHDNVVVAIGDERPKRLECNWRLYNPVPISFRGNTSFMFDYEGLCCPCWKEKL